MINHHPSMIYLEGLMHKKINVWIAFLIIIIIAASFAWIISARAFGGYYFGGWVQTVTPAAVCSNPLTCSACVPCGCGSWDNITFMPVRGSLGSFVCPPPVFFYFGPYPMPGFQIMGSGASPWMPYQIGTSF